jgi:hypothetical protein
MAELNQAINDHETGTYSVTRRTGGAYVAGKWIAGAPSTLSIVASVQPVGDELQDLPEGQHTDDVRVIYTATQLLSRTAATEPDEVSIDGQPYRVFKVEKWDHWGETHYRCWATKTAVP